MDEILSSIKKIIAAEDQAEPIAAKKLAKVAVVQDQPTAEIADADEVLELTDAEEASEDASTLLDEGKARNLARSFSTLQTLAEPGVAPQIVRSGETSLEGLTRELLRPMLKAWLDTNLPPIVEAMVDREITRITKKG